MKAPYPVSPGWSNTRFLAVILTLFFLQAGLIWCFAEREHKISPAATPELALRILPHPISQDQLAASLFAEDPTLFQAPSVHGFSGRAWMQSPPQEYHAAETPAPAEAWLSLSNSGWAPQPPPVKARPEAAFALAAPTSSEFEPTAALMSIDIPPSSFRIEGPLRQRHLLSPSPKLEAQPSAQLLGPTVVQIAADPSGQVVTACVVANSGLPNADASALNVARRLRFAPSLVAGFEPTWGRLVFSWQTIAPAPPAAK